MWYGYIPSACSVRQTLMRGTQKRAEIFLVIVRGFEASIDHTQTHTSNRPADKIIFRYCIIYETSFNIQIHPSRKTDAEIDEYTHIFTDLTAFKILKRELIRSVRRVISNLKLSLPQDGKRKELEITIVKITILACDTQLGT